MVIKSLLEIDYTCIPKPANGVRLQAKLESENPTGLPVGVVSATVSNWSMYLVSIIIGSVVGCLILSTLKKNK